MLILFLCYTFFRWIEISLTLPLLHLSSGHIIRLPCKYHANFSRNQVDKRYDGTVIKAIPDYTVSKCLTSCVGNSTCSHINHKESTNECELMERDTGSMITEVGWTFWTTVTGSVRVSYTAINTAEFDPLYSLIWKCMVLYWTMFCSNSRYDDFDSFKAFMFRVIVFLN